MGSKFNAGQFKKQLLESSEKLYIQQVRDAIANTFPDKDMEAIEVTLNLSSSNPEKKFIITGLTEEEVESVLKKF